jgi:haloacetate dehalogenase
VLLLHGYPQTHIMWRKVAPQLSKRFTLVMPDLRGYGDSSKPPDGENHSGYSKRVMAQDQVKLMKSLGSNRFAVVGHDRGGRVAHRLALDHQDMMEKVVVLDIVPTYQLFRSVTKELATVYFHWFFLIQPAPFPETLLGNNAEFYLRSRMLGRLPSGVIDDHAFAEYLRCFRDPAAIHSSCEDYRAAGSIDLEHDAADLDKKISCPVLALWGAQGAMQPLYNGGPVSNASKIPMAVPAITVLASNNATSVSIKGVGTRPAARAIDSLEFCGIAARRIRKFLQSRMSGVLYFSTANNERDGCGQPPERLESTKRGHCVRQRETKHRNSP